MKLNKEQIAAMAIAVIAEEAGTDLKRIRVISFKEVEKSSLVKYIEENHINYKKYQIGDEIV